MMLKNYTFHLENVDLLHFLILVRYDEKVKYLYLPFYRSVLFCCHFVRNRSIK